MGGTQPHAGTRGLLVPEALIQQSTCYALHMGGAEAPQGGFTPIVQNWVGPCPFFFISSGGLLVVSGFMPRAALKLQVGVRNSGTWSSLVPGEGTALGGTSPCRTCPAKLGEGACTGKGYVYGVHAQVGDAPGTGCAGHGMHGCGGGACMRGASPPLG